MNVTRHSTEGSELEAKGRHITRWLVK